MYGTQRPQSDSAMQKRTHGNARGGCTILLRNELESGTPQRQRCTYWLHYAEGSAMPPLLLSLVFARLPPAARGPMPFFVRLVVRGIAGKVLGSYVNPQISLHLEQ